MSEYSKNILIGGTGRSGTNILKKILGQHRDVATLPFEHRFTIDPRGIVAFIRTYPTSWSSFWPDYKINDLIQFLKELGHQSEDKVSRVSTALANDPVGLKVSPPSYPGWELNKWMPGYMEAVDQLKADLVSFKYHAVWPGTAEGRIENEMLFAPAMGKAELIEKFIPFMERISSGIIKQQGKRIFVEDNTYNILFAEELLQIMPNSILISVSRDPRDVISSAKQQRWAPSNIEQLIDWYLEVMKQWEIQKNLLPPNRFMELKFEDLIESHESALNRVCALAGLDLDLEMLKVDLTRHNIGRWKSDLTGAEADLIERRLAQYL